MNKNKFKVIIDGEIAFELAIKDEHDDFLQVIEKSPDVVLSNLNDISAGDTYSNETFFDTEGNQRTSLIQDEGFSRFAFIKDGAVLFIQDIPNTVEMIVAAYSSSPTFRKV
jgi:hypothetical protein